MDEFGLNFMETIAKKSKAHKGKSSTPDGVSLFRQRAQNMAEQYKKKPSAKKRLSVSSSQSESTMEMSDIRRTRSQSNSLSNPSQNVNHFLDGNNVFARKGRKVPFWWPGKIVKKLSRGYKIQFLLEFGTEDCLSNCVITPEMFRELKLKSDGKKLFKIPEKFIQNFNEACETMNL